MENSFDLFIYFLILRNSYYIFLEFSFCVQLNMLTQVQYEQF